jgi:phosphinothricin acetyltransferase
VSATAIIREATGDDAEAIAAIYAYYVRTSPATFEEEPPDAQEIGLRMQRVQGAGLPWRVMLDRAGDIVAYAYASPYRTRSAYRYTLENSVYVSPHHFRCGFGSAIMRDVIVACERIGYRQMLAVIGDSANTASIGLHERLGFRMVGVHPAIGFKFGRWIDVVHMQLALGEGGLTPPPRVTC